MIFLYFYEAKTFTLDISGTENEDQDEIGRKRQSSLSMKDPNAPAGIV